MALKAVLDSLDGLPEGISGHYVEFNDGKYRLDVESVGGIALEDVSALKSALARERDGRRKAVAHLQDFGEYDDRTFSFTPTLDAGKARDALARLEKLKDAKPDEKSKAEREAWEKQVTEKYGGEIRTKEARISHLTGKIKELLVTSAAKAAIAKHAPEAMDLLLPHVEKAGRVEEDPQGNFSVVVVDEYGNPMITGKQGQTGNMDIDELVGVKFKERFPKVYPGTGSTGSGATGTGTGKVKVDPKLSAEQRLQLYHEGKAS